MSQIPPTTAARRRLVVVALLAGTFLSSLDVTLISVAMPRIAADIGGMDLYAWAFAAYLLASTAMVPIYGKLADLLGRRPTYLAGLALFVFGSLLCGLAPSMPVLVCARAVQGLGAGALLPVTMTIFGDLFSAAERARVQGWFALTWGVSSIAGPAVGGLFVAYWTWRWAFLINVPIGLAVAVLLVTTYPERAERRRVRIDLAGALLLFCALLALLVGIGRRPASLPLALFGLALFFVFALVERRAAAADPHVPIVPPALFSDPVILVGSAGSVLVGAVLFAHIAWVPLYLQAVAGFSPLAAGLLIAPDSITWTLASFLIGSLAARWRYRGLLRRSAALVLAATLAFYACTRLAPGAPALVFFIASQLVFGAGMGGFISSLIIIVQERVPWERRGATTALVQLSRQLGGTLGTAVLGSALAAHLAPRLAAASRPGAAPLSADDLVDPERFARLAQLDDASFRLARAALGDGLATLALYMAAAAALALALTYVFPDVDGAHLLKTETPETPPQTNTQPTAQDNEGAPPETTAA